MMPSVHTLMPSCGCRLGTPLHVCLQEKEAVVLAGQLEDKKWALEKLLGPALTPEGSATRLKSQEARELTQHHYTPDR